jgi:prophage antirepressor-like protein
MTSLAVFNFDSQEIRFVDGKPVANDVAKVLGYADPQSTISKKVDTENKGVAKMATAGGVQSVTVLEEAGIYQLIFGSKLPSAKAFQKWVFSDVLPSIRKTGGYGVTTANPKKAIAHYSDRCADIRKNLVKPKGHWCVIEKCNHLLLEVEKAGYPIDKFDLLDSSVGRRYAQYRREIGYSEPTQSAHYQLPHCPHPVTIACYPSSELGIFSDWLEGIYEERYLNKYLQDKYGKLAKV